MTCPNVAPTIPGQWHNISMGTLVGQLPCAWSMTTFWPTTIVAITTIMFAPGTWPKNICPAWSPAITNNISWAHAVGSTFGISQNFKHYQKLIGQCMLNATNNMQYGHAFICSNTRAIFHGACHDQCNITPNMCNNSAMFVVGHWRGKIAIPLTTPACWNYWPKFPKQYPVLFPKIPKTISRNLAKIPYLPIHINPLIK